MSAMQSLQVVQSGDYMFCFDLKAVGIHLDDGIGTIVGQVQAQVLVDKVNQNLKDFCCFIARSAARM